nr:hypothetical protein [Tanacetum cinerariifolium]
RANTSESSKMMRLITDLSREFSELKYQNRRAEELSRWEAWVRGRIPNSLRFQEEPSIHIAPVPRADDPYVMVRDAARGTREDEDIDTTALWDTQPHESRDEELSTILEKESDDVIKSSVDDLVSIPSESEDTFGSDNEYDLPSCDDFSPIDVPEGKSVTFFNPLFDSNDDFTSSDDESLSDEDVPENNDIKSKASYDSNLDEPALLVTPLFDSNEDECFDPGGDVDEINALDILLYFKNGYYDSKGDVLYLESLLSDDTTPNLPPEVFLDRDSRSLSNINDLEIMVKVFDPIILEKIFSPTYVSLPFKDRHYLFFTYVIRSFLPYFTCPVDYPFLFSSGSEDTIFDPDISAFHFSSLEPVASHRSETFICFIVYPNILNESPMKICSST